MLGLSLGLEVLFIAVNDSTSCQIVRRHFHGNFVAGKNTDVVHTHFARDGCQYHMAVFQAYFEVCVGECLCDFAVLFDNVFFCHKNPS